MIISTAIHFNSAPVFHSSCLFFQTALNFNCLFLVITAFYCICLSLSLQCGNCLTLKLPSIWTTEHFNFSTLFCPNLNCWPKEHTVHSKPTPSADPPWRPGESGLSGFSYGFWPHPAASRSPRLPTAKLDHLGEAGRFCICCCRAK